MKTLLKSNVKNNSLTEEGREAGTYGKKLLENAELKVFERNSNLLSEDTIEIMEANEYSSLCPRSSLPDYAGIKVLYIPNKYVLDEVSFKFYTNSFITFRGGHETTCNEYLNDLVEKLQPKLCIVFGNFGIRGNVKTIPTACYIDESLEQDEIKRLINFSNPYYDILISKVIKDMDSEF